MSTSLPVLDPKELQTKLDDYYANIEHRLQQAEADNVSLSIEKGSLVAEVGMLREQLARADTDRVRLQAVASTLSGELMAIRDVIDGSVRRALEAGIIAQKTPPAEPERLTQKAAMVELEKLAEEPRALQAPPQETRGAIAPPVDWSQIPQGKPS